MTYDAPALDHPARVRVILAGRIPDRAGRQMKLVRRMDGALEPVTDIGRAKMAGWPIGEIREVKIPQPGREWPQHASYWSEVNDIADNLPEWAIRHFYRTLLGDLGRNGTVDAPLLHEVIKTLCGIESESYDKLDQDQADKFFADAREILGRWKSLFQGEENHW